MVFYRAAPHEHTPGCQTRVYNGLKCPEDSGSGEAVGGVREKRERERTFKRKKIERDRD